MTLGLIIVVALLYFAAAFSAAFDGNFSQCVILVGYVIANIGLALSLS